MRASGERSATPKKTAVRYDDEVGEDRLAGAFHDEVAAEFPREQEVRNPDHRVGKRPYQAL